MLKIVLCDDNSNILEKLEKMLEKILTKHNYEASIVFKSGNSKEILNYVANNRVDILFLDINLGVNKSGLKLAEEIRKINKKTVDSQNLKCYYNLAVAKKPLLECKLVSKKIKKVLDR